MPKPRLVPPAMVPPAMPSGVLSHIANDQWVMMTTQWVMMTTRNTILTAKSLSWTKPGTCESGRLRGQIYTSTGKRAKSVHLGWCRSLSGTRRRHGPNLVDRAVRIPLFPGWQIALRPPHHHDIHNAEPMFGEPRSTIVALPKGATGPFDFHCSINPRSTAGLEPRAALQKRSRRENVALEITAMALKKWPFFCKNWFCHVWRVCPRWE